MERILDVDQAAAVFERRRSAWAAEGFEVSALTWRDQARDWPDQVVSGRENAREPDSVGLRLTADGFEAMLVVYAGGWLHVEWEDFTGGEAGSEVADARSLDELDAALTAVAGRMRRDRAE